MDRLDLEALNRFKYRLCTLKYIGFINHSTLTYSDDLQD